MNGEGCLFVWDFPNFLRFPQKNLDALLDVGDKLLESLICRYRGPGMHGKASRVTGELKAGWRGELCACAWVFFKRQIIHVVRNQFSPINSNINLPDALLGQSCHPWRFYGSSGEAGWLAGLSVGPFYRNIDSDGGFAITR